MQPDHLGNRKASMAGDVGKVLAVVTDRDVMEPWGYQRGGFSRMQGLDGLSDMIFVFIPVGKFNQELVKCRSRIDDARLRISVNPVRTRCRRVPCPIPRERHQRGARTTPLPNKGIIHRIHAARKPPAAPESKTIRPIRKEFSRPGG